MCEHKNLEYSPAFKSARCKDCGKLWRDEQPEAAPITVPYPIYIPQMPQVPVQPYLPSPYQPYPGYPIITCGTDGVNTSVQVH
jgi:hypothetical protein